MLPATIRHVQINTASDATLDILLKDFPELRASRLKDLKELVVSYYCKGTARGLVESAGATVKCDMKPAWKRDLEWRVEGLRGLYHGYV